MNLTLESRGALSHMDLGLPRSKGIVIGFWSVTALFCLQMGFTAYAQLSLPQVAEAFTRLGFPDYFRVELAWAKLLGVVPLLAPVPARLNEWALRRLRHHSRLCTHRPLRGGRWPGGAGPCGGHQRALGALVLLLAPPEPYRRAPDARRAVNATATELTTFPRQTRDLNH
jgi:hypothetical protein